MPDDVVGLPTPDPQWIAVTKPLSAYQLSRPLCCQHAEEYGYRRGYRDGYRYALWDVGRYLRIPDALWEQVERFLSTVLPLWVWRATRHEGEPVSREDGPRFRKEPVRRKKGS